MEPNTSINPNPNLKPKSKPIPTITYELCPSLGTGLGVGRFRYGRGDGNDGPCGFAVGINRKLQYNEMFGLLHKIELCCMYAPAQCHFCVQLAECKISMLINTGTTNMASFHHNKYETQMLHMKRKQTVLYADT